MITYDEFIKKAQYFDEIMPKFFVYGFDYCKNYWKNSHMLIEEYRQKISAGLISQEENDDLLDLLYNSPEEIFSGCGIQMLVSYYPNIISILNLDDLCLIETILQWNEFLASLCIDGEKQKNDLLKDVSPDQWSFYSIAKSFSAKYIEDFLQFRERAMYENGFEFSDRRYSFERHLGDESVNFARNDSVWGVPVEDELINKLASLHP